MPARSHEPSTSTILACIPYENKLCAHSKFCRVTVRDPANAQPCSGHGVCIGATNNTGYCQCRAGYSGDACSLCTAQFLRRGSVCIFMPGALASCSDGVKNGHEEGVDCGGNCATACSSQAPGNLIDSGILSLRNVLVVASVVLAVVLLCVGWWYCRCRAHRIPSRQGEGASSGLSYVSSLSESSSCPYINAQRTLTCVWIVFRLGRCRKSGINATSKSTAVDTQIGTPFCPFNPALQSVLSGRG